MLFFSWLIRDVQILRQLEGHLPDGQSIRIMQSCDGFHVRVGDHGIMPPDAVPGEKVLHEILRQWLGV